MNKPTFEKKCTHPLPLGVECHCEINKPTLRNNQDGTCNCRPLGNGCFFQEIDGSRCGCKCHTKPIFETTQCTFESDNFMECQCCHKKKEDVSIRANAYAQDVGNSEGAMWQACDECDYQNRMDI